MTIFLQFVNDRPTRLDILSLLRFLGIVAIVIAVHSIIFHYIMEYEGQSYSWITGIYWTLTVMSTLGFGDITFESDIGRIFSAVVLLSGIIFLLILLPFTFIEFFYAPWMRARDAARAPRQLSEKTSGHAILTHFDTVTSSLITKLMQYQYDYVLLIDDLTEALRLHEMGYRVMLGALDDPETYRRAQVHQALFVGATGNDQTNTNVAFTVREISETVPIVAVANRHASVDILELAGCSHVIELGRKMGQVLARQVAPNTSQAHVIGRFGNLHIAEASVQETALVDKPLNASAIQANTGVTVLGIWERGQFREATSNAIITSDTSLILGGSETDIARYNDVYSSASQSMSSPVVIIGGGRVGRAVAQALQARGMDYRIVEKNQERIPADNAEYYICGDAAELEVLDEAGIQDTTAVVVTTHDDDINIYLTIYCRRLRPNIQIISRAVLDRNVTTLHRAGADFVMSYASTGANAMMNLIGHGNILMIDEKLDIFEVKIPHALAGRTPTETNIHNKTNCQVVATYDGDQYQFTLNSQQPLPTTGRILLIGTPDAEEKFLKLYT